MNRIKGVTASAKTLLAVLTPMTDKLIEDMLHGNGIPRCGEWDMLVRHAKALEASFYRVNRELDNAHAAAKAKRKARPDGR